MSSVQDIESAIKRLNNRELSQLSGWFDDYRAAKWDERFSADVPSGKLDKLGEAADRAFEQGQCRPL
jgi:hypothetical protein